MNAEDMQRFEIEAQRPFEQWITCTRCGWETLFDVLPTPVTLAELVQRAGEHTEVCR